MIKTFGLLDRRDDITKAQFHEHWAGIHAEHAVKLVPVMQRYVQNHCADENVPGFEPPCDGAPEVWLKDLDGAARLGTMPEYLNGAYIDEPLFMRKRSGGVLVSEEVIIEGPEIG
ncbi:MAG: EthD domain-containing protein, partial [Alphaproteobacteria bacterium]|nr:EthD domain-containing protein [Alphaproteobacteria bacterium]